MESENALVSLERDVLSYYDDVPVGKPYILIPVNRVKDDGLLTSRVILEGRIFTESSALLFVGRHIHWILGRSGKLNTVVDS